MSRYLYRGVNAKLDAELDGRLRPKRQGEFLYEFTADCTEITCDCDRITIHPSNINAVHRHQLLQKGYPTSGISTTPKFVVAKQYAKGSCEGLGGFVYKIDREMLPKAGVSEYIVSDYVANPAVPGDDEVILVTSDGKELPENIVVEKILV
jgi:hypothetical protein